MNDPGSVCAGKTAAEWLQYMAEISAQACPEEADENEFLRIHANVALEVERAERVGNAVQALACGLAKALVRQSQETNAHWLHSLSDMFGQIINECHDESRDCGLRRADDNVVEDLIRAIEVTVVPYEGK